MIQGQLIGVRNLDACECRMRLAFKHLESPGAVLIVGQEQVLGGGTVVDSSGPTARIVECWGVTDLTAKHWSSLLDSGDAQVYDVPMIVAAAVKSTLERFNADGARRVQAEVDRRIGALDALVAVVRASQQPFSQVR
jgi:hypothetical protein